ncbi:Uncharacterised protein [Actinobaculum suis]|uniref:Lipoprotein n=1 Tax=Actinobaculum suis TaxID=1657 RepID=A0A7Z8YC03_9ACTO|nr:hypothetical protein [Actinobaculum suis]VDG77334.1 Uncharacterised protein [Actinobaculum suis]
MKLKTLTAAIGIAILALTGCAKDPTPGKIRSYTVIEEKCGTLDNMEILEATPERPGDALVWAGYPKYNGKSERNNEAEWLDCFFIWTGAPEWIREEVRRPLWKGRDRIVPYAVDATSREWEDYWLGWSVDKDGMITMLAKFK